MTYKLSANSHPASSFNDLSFIIKQNRSSERLNHLPKNTVKKKSLHRTRALSDSTELS